MSKSLQISLNAGALLALLRIFLRVCVPLWFCIFFFEPQVLAQSNKPPLGFDSVSKQANEARDTHRLDDAVRLYKQALVLRPKWAEGWFSLGTIEYDRNNYSAAAQAFRKLLPLAPKDGTSHLMLGLCEFELGQDELSLKHIEQARILGVANNPQLFQVMLYHDGVLWLRKGRFENAQEVLKSLCKGDVNSDELQQALGLSIFRILPRAAPPKNSAGASVIMRAGHAECLAGRRQTEPARQEYKALLDEYPEYPNLHYVYGRFLLSTSDLDAALSEFEREIQIHPQDITSRWEIASIKYRVDSPAGLPYAEEAVRLDPRMPFGHYLLGLLYEDTEQYEKAIPQLEIAKKAFPNEQQVFFALGNVYAKVGRKEDAARERATFKKLVQQRSQEDPTTTYGQALSEMPAIKRSPDSEQTKPN